MTLYQPRHDTTQVLHDRYLVSKIHFVGIFQLK